MYSTNEEEHKEHLNLVLKNLREQHLYAKFNKCELYKHKIQYLGRTISKEGLYVDLRKVRAIMNWPIPKDVSNFPHLRDHGILTNIYRRIFKIGLSHYFLT